MNPGKTYAAITVDTEYPVSWDDAQSADNCIRLVELSAALAIPLTWMIKVSAQAERSVAEHFFTKIRPSLPQNHEIGLHVHFDDENRDHYITDPDKRRRLIQTGCDVLKDFGVQPSSFRAGCLRAETADLKILLDMGISIDSSVAPGVVGTKDLADWQSVAATEPYHPDLNDIARIGKSALIEAPLLTDGKNPLWLDRWQETSRAVDILETALARGDRFLCLIGHDGSANLDSVRKCHEILSSLKTQFVTLSGLAKIWEKFKANALATALVLAVILAGRLAAADMLTPVGVLGNSGEQGSCLMRVDAAAFGKGVSGVAVDKDRTLWTGAGTAINRVTLNGALIASFPLQPAGSLVESGTFALLDDHLYFIGRLPDRRRALFALAVTPGANAAPASAVPVVTNLPPCPDYAFYQLAAQPLDGQLYMIADGNIAGRRVLDILRFRPGTNAFARAFSVSGFTPNGIAVDPAGRRIYVAGRLYPPDGSPNSSDFSGITALTPDGRLAGSGFPVACSQTMFSPVQYHGHVNFAGGALWDLAWYGYLARLGLDAREDPGTVEMWHHELGRLAQVVDMGDVAGTPSGVLAYAPGGNASLYIGHWQANARKIDWVRRIGCLPVITSLWLTPEGWVSIGTGECQAWWRFKDAADAPPRKAELHVALTPCIQDKTVCMAPAALYHLNQLASAPPVAMGFTWEPMPRNEAISWGNTSLPFKRPVGMTCERLNHPGNGLLLVSDADTRKLWQTVVGQPGVTPEPSQWKPVVCADAGVEKTLESATDLSWLPDRTILAAVEGGLVTLAQHTNGLAVVAQFRKWGDTPDAHFGAHLRFARDGERLLVADTDRHRVLLFDGPSRRLLAQAGATDQPGDDLRHFRDPTLVAFIGSRAIVADSGNQRVVRFIIEGR